MNITVCDVCYEADAITYMVPSGSQVDLPSGKLEAMHHKIDLCDKHAILFLRQILFNPEDMHTNYWKWVPLEWLEKRKT